MSEAQDTTEAADGQSRLTGVLGPEVRFVTLLEARLPKLICTMQLSKTSSFTLRVDGPFGEREAASLMRLLSVQVGVLSA